MVNYYYLINMININMINIIIIFNFYFSSLIYFKYLYTVIDLILIFY